MVALVTVTAGVVFIYALYVLVRAIKIPYKSFLITITTMILIGTSCGPFSFGYLY